MAQVEEPVNESCRHLWNTNNPDTFFCVHCYRAWPQHRVEEAVVTAVFFALMALTILGGVAVFVACGLYGWRP